MRRNALKIRVLGLVCLCAATGADSGAQTYDMRIISRPLTINRDPVISETGLIAWMYYDTNQVVSAHSHIGVYSQNERIDLTEGQTAVFNAAVRPQVHSNTLVFIANTLTAEGGRHWAFREVPGRDDGEQPELEANVSATEVDGVQQFIRVNREAAPGEGLIPLMQTEDLPSRRAPSGNAEVWRWQVGDEKIERITADGRNDFAAAIWGDTIAWQKARGWPFGWEIMALQGETMMQMTTNFFYEMSPDTHNGNIVWYGWDGFDYEIFMYDAARNETMQITSNRHDDISPRIWNDVVVWESYSGVEGDIYMWRNGEITQVSQNIDDDINPRIWNNKIVWQGSDGDVFNIFLYDIDRGGEPIQVTSATFDNVQPQIHDDLVVWMGYHDNWDSEIFYADIRNISTAADIRIVQLTDRDEDDRDPQTANRRIVWVSEENGMTRIVLAEPQ